MRCLEATGISKRFGSTRALEGVSLAMDGGEILALIGENGAGKSTLIKILAGLYGPDEGTVLLDGTPYRPRSPADAFTAGVVLVPQELRVVPGLTVAQNILLGRLPQKRVIGCLPVLDRQALNAQANELLERVGLACEPDLPVGELGFAQRQLVVIARALGHRARLLILDEPTASLEAREVQRLFETLRRLRDQSVAIIYVSHRLAEVPALADRCLILRDGRCVATLTGPVFEQPRLISEMTGRTLVQSDPRARHFGPVRLSTTVMQSQLSCREGEVLGIAGLLGSGSSAVLRTLFGCDGRSDHSVRRSIEAGVGLVPGTRAESLVQSLSVRDNIVLAHLDVFSGAFGRDDSRIDAAVVELMDLLDIRPRNPALPVGQLSGGNQQKVVFARWLVGRLEVLLLDEPTSGIDIAAKALIHAQILDFSSRGGSVILSSSDMPELLALSDTVQVLRRGHLGSRLERTKSLDETALRALLEAEA